MEWLIPVAIIEAIVALIFFANWMNSSGQVDQLEKALQHERSNDSGWEDECKFWRNAFLPDAESKRIEDQFKDNA